MCGKGPGNLNASTIQKLSGVLQKEIESKKDELLGDIYPDENRLYFDRQINEAEILGCLTSFKWENPEDYDEDNPGNPEDDPFWYIAVPVPRPYFQFQLAAFDIADNTLKPTFKKGELLVCAPIYKLEQLPLPRSYVVVHEVDPSGSFRFMLRQYTLDPAGGEWLMPVGEDGRDHPLYLDRLPVDSPRLVATFVVICKISPFPDL